MKSVILFIGLFVLSSVVLKECESSNGAERIAWSDKRKLTWKDFKGKPVKDDPYSARTFTQIYFEYEETEYSIEFDMVSYFYRYSSWSKSKSKKETSQWLLEHEQLHFDITELMARKVRKEFSAYRSYDLSTTYRELKAIYVSYDTDEHLIMNTAYDEETAHGTIREKQKEWEKKIEHELYKLRRYADPKVKIPRIIVVNN